MPLDFTKKIPYNVSASAVDTRLSSRLSAVRPSATGVVSEAARRLAARGRSVLSLSEGELDFDTLAHIQHAAIRAITEGQTRYTSVGGTHQLRASIVRKFVRDNGLHYREDEVIASTGTKQILFNALLATLNEGDEAIVVAPFWVSCSEMIRIAGGEPVVITPNAGLDFKLRLLAEASRAACEQIVTACHRLRAP